MILDVGDRTMNTHAAAKKSFGHLYKPYATVAKSAPTIVTDGIRDTVFNTGCQAQSSMSPSGQKESRR